VSVRHSVVFILIAGTEDSGKEPMLCWRQTGAPELDWPGDGGLGETRSGQQCFDKPCFVPILFRESDVAVSRLSYSPIKSSALRGAGECLGGNGSQSPKGLIVLFVAAEKLK
jgi:hypothetical protein